MQDVLAFRGSKTKQNKKDHAYIGTLITTEVHLWKLTRRLPSLFAHLKRIDNRELKKRLKNREKEAKKAEKAANAPAPAESATKKTKEISAAEEEENLNPNVRLFLCCFLC